MPRVRRHNHPLQLLAHLVDRVGRRNISADQLGFLADWLYAQPEVPEGKWFKKFSGMTVCGWPVSWCPDATLRLQNITTL